MLHTVFDILDWALKEHRSQRHEHLVGVEVGDLGAEPTAGVRRNYADLVFRQPEQCGQPSSHRDGGLRRVPYTQHAIAPIPLREHASRLYRMTSAALDRESGAEYVLSLREGRVRVACDLDEVTRDVPRHTIVNEGSSLRGGLLEVDCHRQG